MSSKKYIKNTIEDLNKLLLAVLTGQKDFDRVDNSYQKMRRRLTALAPLIGHLPDFLSSSDNLWALWNTHIKDTLPNYESRRKFIREKYENYYNNSLQQFGRNSFEQELILRDLAIEEQIGEGGFSVVYKAEHIVLEEPRAIKKLDPLFADEEGEIKALRRFSREVKILSNLNHPNIVKVYDAGLANENPYLIMEFLDGSDLETCIKRDGHIEEKCAVEIMLQILSAISSAHDMEIVHRDIKPKNVMWDEEKAVVLDYGAGQWLEHSLSTRMTTSPVGTVGYIANELFENPKLIEKNLDCYSVGVLYHYILTGHIPNVGSPTYYLEQMSIDSNVTNFILKAISPADERFKDGKEMLDALRIT